MYPRSQVMLVWRGYREVVGGRTDDGEGIHRVILGEIG